MKLAILCLFAAIVATQARELTLLERDIAAGYRATCRQKIGTTIQDGVELRKGRFHNATPQQKCYLRCVAIEAGYVTSKGKVNEDKIVSDLTPLIGAEEATAAVDKCKGLTGTDECDTSRVRFACLHRLNAAYVL